MEIDTKTVKVKSIGFFIAGFLMLTLFHSPWWTLINLPICFFYGAILRGRNEVKGFKYVTELEGRIVK